MQAKVGAGVKESEVSYQMAFSKQELRRVVKEYPAREVKKGLENLYRKVEKHLCEEENLLQVNERELSNTCSIFYNLTIVVISLYKYANYFSIYNFVCIVIILFIPNYFLFLGCLA